jgi:hypothetical protein
MRGEIGCPFSSAHFPLSPKHKCLFELPRCQAILKERLSVQRQPTVAICAVPGFSYAAVDFNIQPFSQKETVKQQRSLKACGAKHKYVAIQPPVYKDDRATCPMTGPDASGGDRPEQLIERVTAN